MTFRDGLLDGCRVACVGGPAAAIPAELRSNGAWVDSTGAADAADEQALEAWVAGRLPLGALVLDARRDFGAGGREGLRTALDHAWIAARAVANGALIGGGGGRLLFVAPTPDAGVHARAARAGVENLARTLSVEWARFGITAVTLLPGGETTDQELATLICFLLSPAGGYFTGCRFELGAVPADAAFIPAS